jgi:nucleotide-binding universal stress UspA family protein
VNVLIAVDLTESTAGVVAAVKRLFPPQGVKHWLLHVVEPEPDFVGYEAGPQTVRDALAKRYRAQHESLQRLADLMRADGYDCTALLLQGPLAETITGEAARVHADVVAVGSERKGMAARLMLGSTSTGVIRAAGVPVLVVPA